VPEFLVLEVESGSQGYLEWLHASVKAPGGTGTGTAG